jgi:hypothetical protein
MNSPPPGWHPDPTARHDYRYWDGWEWTDDVADGGVTAYDPLPGDDGYGGYAYDPYAYGSYGNGAEPATRRVPDLSYQPPYYATGDETPGAARKGPSARLLVGVGLVAVAMVAGLVFVLVSSGQDDEQADGTEISDRADRGDRDRPSGGSTNPGETPPSSDTTAPPGPTSTTTAPGDPGTTAPGGPAAPPAPGGPGTTAAPPGGGGDGGSGDEAAVVNQLAEMFENSSGGAMSAEQARCMAQGMVDTVGVEGAQALTGSAGGMPPTLSPQQQQELQQLAMECGMGGA